MRALLTLCSSIFHVCGKWALTEEKTVALIAANELDALRFAVQRVIATEIDVAAAAAVAVVSGDQMNLDQQSLLDLQLPANKL